MDDAARFSRNRWLFVAQGVLYYIGIAFFDPSTVLPLFIQSVSGNLAYVGAAVAIRQAASLVVQVLFGMVVVKVRRVPRFLTGMMFLSYSAPFLVAAGLAAGLRGEAAIALLFAALCVMWLSDGFIAIGYFDLMGRSMAPADRGRTMGSMQFLGGAGALASAAVIRWVLGLDAVEEPVRFAVLFLCSGSVLFLSAFFFVGVRDAPRRTPDAGYRPLRHLWELPELIRSRPAFSAALACQALLTVALAVSAFTLPFARSVYRLDERSVGLLLGIQVAGALIGGMMVMLVSPRFGSRRSIQVFALLLAVGCLAGLGAATDLLPAFPALAVLSAATGVCVASWAGFMGYIVDIADDGRIPLFVTGNSVVLLPLAGVGLVAGFLAQRGGPLPLQAMCLAAAVAAAAFSLRLPVPPGAGGTGADLRPDRSDAPS